MYDKADMLVKKALNSPPLGGAVVVCHGFLISEGVACWSTLVTGVQQVSDQTEETLPYRIMLRIIYNILHAVLLI